LFFQTAIHGADVDICILEEAARIPAGVLYAILPTLAVRDSCFIAISTPTDEDNYVSHMFDAKNPNVKDWILRIRVEIWCSECKETGLVLTCGY
jgi:hypothetical protein